MTTTVRNVQDIVLTAIYLTGEYEYNETPEARFLEEGIFWLNLQLDSMSKPEGLMIPVNKSIEFSLAGGKSEYTFSHNSFSDIQSNLIAELQSCVLIIDGQQYSLRMLQSEQWTLHSRILNLQQRPSAVCLTQENDQSKLTFYQTPDKVYDCKILVKTALSNVALGDDMSNVPVYYHMFLILQLAKQLSEVNKSLSWTDNLQKMYETELRAIEAANQKSDTLIPPVELRQLGYFYNRNPYGGWY